MRRNALVVLLALILVALAGCANPAVRDGDDADGDGLSDNEERAGWTVTAVTSTGTRSYPVTSNPAVADTSGAGLKDVYKALFGLDPRMADTDGDGLSDCQEVRLKLGAACLDPAHAGASDGGYATRGDHWDSDGDGLSDGDEVNGSGATRAVTDPLDPDSDNDGLFDGVEAQYGARPDLADTDGDGCKDGVDALPAFAQRFAPGLQALRLPQGEASLHFVLADANLYVPASGTFPATGSLQEGAALEPAAKAPTTCAVSPKDPWVAVQLVASRGDGAVLDVTSQSMPAGTDRAHWNLATGNVSWSKAGPTLPVPLVWTGADGEVRFTPRVVRPS